MAIPRSSPAAAAAAAKQEPEHQVNKKRNKDLGVRVVGRWIYDSDKGKTCHQCRQKTLDVAASCKNTKDGKPCTFNFCHKCLLNRYGEKAAEVEASQDWSCPKCRGVCNCSCCMKKKGHQPTGILVHTAKKTGFSSVLDLLHHNGLEVSTKKELNDVVASPKKSSSPKKGEVPSEQEHCKQKEGQKQMERKKQKEGKKMQNDVKLLVAIEVKEKAASVKGGKSREKTHLKHKTSIGECSGSEMTYHAEPEAVPAKVEMKSLESAVDGDAEARVNHKRKVSAQVIGTKRENKQKYEKCAKEGTLLKHNISGGECSGPEMTSCAESEAVPAKVGMESLKTAVNGDAEARENCKGKISARVNGTERENKQKYENGASKVKTHLKHKIFGGKFSCSEMTSHVEPEAVPANVEMENLETASGGQVNCKGKISTLANGTKRENKHKDENGATNANFLKLPGKHSSKQDPSRTMSMPEDSKIEIPKGAPLLTIGGVDLPVDNVGSALQFLEFCKAFSKVLGLKKGQPESILREMTSPRVVRRNRVSYSAGAQFHMSLLSLIQKDRGQESLSSAKRMGSWPRDLEKYVQESQAVVQKLPCTGNGTTSLEYDSLELSEKLDILNFLCHEALGTDKLRSWIDKEEIKFRGKKREAREEFITAKSKEKDLQQKLKDEMAKAMLSLRGDVPLSISDYDNLISDIKSEAKKVHAELVESQKLLRKRKLRSGAVRTEPVLQDIGKIYWRLEGSGISNIMIQDVENFDLVRALDRWFVLDDEQEQVVIKHFTSFRNKRLKKYSSIMEGAPASMLRLLTDYNVTKLLN